MGSMKVHQASAHFRSVAAVLGQPHVLSRVQKTKNGKKKEEVTYETKVYMGRDHLVVPVTMLVEGVIQGALATKPEFVSYNEMTRCVGGWNGRPLTMGHPKVQGAFVSAGHPTVHEDWAFGIIFNTTAPEGKLDTEAWIDIDRVAELGGTFASTLDRILEGEAIEVSTGLFVDLTDETGTFGGKDYEQVWSNIVPDHLAILEEGVVGACSREDGCGIPPKPKEGKVNIRVNKDGVERLFMSAETFRANHTKETSVSQAATVEAPISQGVLTRISNAISSALGALGNPTVAQRECTCEDEVLPGTPEVSPETGVIVNGDASLFSQARAALIGNSLQVQELPNDLTVDDARRLLGRALSNAYKSNSDYGYAYVSHLTKDKVVYERYRYSPDYSYVTFQESYTIENGVATLGGDAEEVVVLSKIVPVKSASTMKANLAALSVSETPVEEPEATTTTSETTEGAETEMSQTTTAEGTTPSVNTSTPEAPKQPTLQELLANASPEMRESIEVGARLHAQQKSNVVKALLATNRCKFSEEELNKMTFDTLQNMAELAQVPSFNGRALPSSATEPTQQTLKDNEGYSPAPSTEDFLKD